MPRKLFCCLAALFIAQASIALGNDADFFYDGERSLPTVDGMVVIETENGGFLAPSAPGFAAPALAWVGQPGFSFGDGDAVYTSIAAYQAAYSELLQEIANDPAADGPPLQTVIVPEPSSLALLGLGTAGLFLAARRRRA